MKKLLAILLICLIPTFAGAVDWHKADSIVFAWDAPTTYEDGTAIPDGLVISYDVYTKNVDGSNITMMLTTNDLQSTVVLLKGDKKFVGVAAHYVDPDGIAV
ncbi:MAG: hypothetical protein GWN00_13985, partial [Aliifodinibius sp.]|nr:hypothetical protein [Fodinibius sp.]NIY25876.1 hypothetical protein [Fodinibius sp.]